VSDREIQDSVIRALADAPFRASPDWRGLALADPTRLERFARFLARHFYHERLVHFFKYSRALARVTGRRPEAVLHGAGFDALLPTVVLGSRETARAVAALAVRHVRPASAPQTIPYLADLLEYEEAMMIAEAGPRVWRDDAREVIARSREQFPPEKVGPRVWRDDAREVIAWSREQFPPEKVEGTVLLDLAYDLPAVLPKLLQPWTEVPQASPQHGRLLIARSPHGRVTVARADAAVASVVELADGRKTLPELARETGLRSDDLEATLAGLADLGAVRFATGS